MSSVNGALGTISTSYASGIKYASGGGMARMGLGNSVVETTSYSWDRQQAAAITAVNGSGSTLLGLGYSRCPNYAASCSNNNGNIWQQSMQRAGGTWNQTYAYGDGVNRLTGVSETGPATGWTETYGYDFYGNRWVASTTEQTLTAETPQGSAWYLTTNRISGWGYDGAGNVTVVAKTVREFCRMNHLAITRSTPFSRRQESPIVVQSGLWLVRAVKCTIRRIIMEAS